MSNILIYDIQRKFKRTEVVFPTIQPILAVEPGRAVAFCRELKGPSRYEMTRNSLCHKGCVPHSGIRSNQFREDLKLLYRLKAIMK